MLKLTHYKPNVSLSQYIKKITVFKSKGKIKDTILVTPTPYLYFSYNQETLAFAIIENKEPIKLDRLNIAGAKMFKRISLSYDGVVKSIVVELNASAFYYLFHISPDKIIDSIEPLSNFVTKENSKILLRDLRSTEDTQKQIARIENFFLELSYKALPFNSYIENAIQIIEKNRGTLPIKELVKNLPVSARQFSRLFKKIVGLSPKQFSLVIQFINILKILDTKKYSSIQDIANKADFYDLAHFLHIFKKLTGVSTTEFINSDKHIIYKYYEM